MCEGDYAGARQSGLRGVGVDWLMISVILIDMYGQWWSVAIKFAVIAIQNNKMCIFDWFVLNNDTIRTIHLTLTPKQFICMVCSPENWWKEDTVEQNQVDGRFFAITKYKLLITPPSVQNKTKQYDPSGRTTGTHAFPYV